MPFKMAGMKTNLVALATLLALGGFLLAQDEQPRTWTSSDGKKLEGTLEDFDGDQVQLRTERGVFKFAISRLSEADQKYIKDWAANAPLKVGEFPDFVEVPLDLEVETVSEDGPFVYRSPHFEFHAPERLSKSVVRDFSRIFEATYEVIKALPVGFDPQPRDDGYFRTELYGSMADYYSAGGLQGSAGVYMPREDKIMIPLTQLGVKKVGERWIMDPDADSGTLNHEITHQVTRRWLGPWPVWFIEGLADYVEAMRYNKGKYTLNNMAGRIEEAIMTYPVTDKTFPMVGVEQLLTIDHRTWNAMVGAGQGTMNYRSASVMVFYFMHLDGDGDGRAVAEYMRALAKGENPGEALQKCLIRDRDFAALQEEVYDKVRKAGIRIEFP